MNTTGFPCIHIIQEAIQADRGLVPQQFHPHWHLYAIEDAPPIDRILLVQDPLPVRRRGRPAGAMNFSQATSTQATSSQILSIPEPPLSQFDRSTQREPSAYEYVAEGPRGGRGGRGGRGRIRGTGAGRPRGSRARGGVSKAKGGRSRGRRRGQTAEDAEDSHAEDLVGDIASEDI